MKMIPEEGAADAFWQLILWHVHLYLFSILNGTLNICLCDGAFQSTAKSMRTTKHYIYAWRLSLILMHNNPFLWQCPASTPQIHWSGFRLSARCGCRDLLSFLHRSIRGHPHGNASVWKQTFCIVLADQPHVSCKRSACKCTSFKPGLRVKNAALAFSCGRRICRLCVSITPSPHPSTSSLRPLKPRRLITTTTVDYVLVFVPQKILSLSGLLGQNILLLCHYAEQKTIMDNRPFSPSPSAGESNR